MSPAPSQLARIEPDAAPFLRDAAIQAVMAALAADGAQPRFVGGCVRNAVLAAGPTDVDIAIDVEPGETIRLLDAAGLRAIPTGVEHGTVTTLAADVPLEVTSLRRDVETDGRRAVVAFTRDWAEDAARRDFTMNALYADQAGRLYDPLGDGVADLLARRVHFIGRAEDRIREDYLRILRFYRFCAWYGDGGADLDGLAATELLRDGLARLARERVGHEMRKLLAAPSPSRALTLMAERGVLTTILPGADAARLPPLEALEARHGIAPDWPRRLGALFAADPADRAPDAADLARELGAQLKLSNKEVTALAALERARALPPPEAGYRCGWEAARDAVLLAAADHAAETGAPIAAQDRALSAAHAAAERRLPIAAADLIAAGLVPGPALGRALAAAETDWIASGFALDRAALLQRALHAAG